MSCQPVEEDHYLQKLLIFRGNPQFITQQSQNGENDQSHSWMNTWTNQKVTKPPNKAPAR